MVSYLLVGLGGALGAMARYGLSLRMPVSGAVVWLNPTLVANVLGSLLMGLLVGALLRFVPAFSEQLRLFFGVGLLGGFTTFSSFSLDAFQMAERGQWGAFSAYILVSVVAGLCALALAMFLMRAGA